jgi:hypothetical protein
MEPDKNEPKSRKSELEETGEIDLAVIEAARAKANDQGLDNEFALLDARLKDDSLARERQFDMEKLAPIISDTTTNFDEKVLETPYDPVVAEKLRQYEAEKEVNAMPKETFYEPTGWEKDMSESAGRLSEDQKDLLDTVTRLADSVGFDEVHPDLSRTDSVIPTSAPPIDYGAPELPQPAPKPEPKPLDFTGVDVQANLTYDKMQYLTGQKDSLDLLEREKGKPHEIGSVQRAPRKPPMSMEMKIGIGLVALAVPLFSWSMYLQSNANAEADRMQEKVSTQLAMDSAEKQSLANQNQQPFRMPAGSVGPIGGAPIAGGDGGRITGSTGDQLKWTPPANPAPEPTPAQLEKGRRIIQTADEMQMLGNTAQAAAILSAGLGDCPGDVNLRIAAARAYLSMNDYISARRILEAGMKNARNLGEFNLLKAVLQQVPGAI